MVSKSELKKLYLTNTIMEYIGVNCIVIMTLLLLSNVSNEPIVHGIKDVMTFVMMNTIIYLIKFMAVVARSLIFRHKTGTIVNAFETEHGRYAITIEKDHENNKRRTAVMAAPNPSYNMYVTGKTVEYVKFLNRCYLCIF